MSRYIIKRIITAVLVLLGISLLTFILGVASPGDPALFALNSSGLDAPTEAQLLAMREELGLNRPLPVQYLSWLGDLLQGNLGTSYVSGRSIAEELLLRLPVTMTVAALSLLSATVLGIGLGVVCAVHKDGSLDKFVNGSVNVVLAMPGFWLAMLLILVFCEQLRWLPTSGVDAGRNFVLPVLVLSLPTIATICRFMRGALLEEFGKQYYTVAKARGMSNQKLLLCYALPNAAIPVIALLGNYFASVLGGSIIIENIFAIPGISSMALEAIRYRDYPVLQAYVLVSGLLLISVILLVDLLIVYFNPKVRLEK